MAEDPFGFDGAGQTLDVQLVKLFLVLHTSGKDFGVDLDFRNCFHGGLSH